MGFRYDMFTADREMGSTRSAGDSTPTPIQCQRTWHQTMSPGCLI